MKIVAALSVLLLVLPVIAGAAAVPAPRTAEAVKAADDSWMEAEIRGDGAFLSDLLLDGYVSVDPAGKVTTKQQIVAGATKRGRSETFAREVERWRAAHPSEAAVTMFGDTAVLTWNSANPGSATPVHSSDVFVYRDGRWRAIYSQHSTSSN